MAQTKTICFANNKGGSGKSTTCANVGYSMSTLGKKVLLIDCDMHRPTQNISFGVTAQNGLSEYLTGLCETAEISETEYETDLLGYQTAYDEAVIEGNQKKIAEAQSNKEAVLASYAAGNAQVQQLIDITLLQNNMLTGEALNNFVKRSIDMMK